MKLERQYWILEGHQTLGCFLIKIIAVLKFLGADVKRLKTSEKQRELSSGFAIEAVSSRPVKGRKPVNTRVLTEKSWNRGLQTTSYGSPIYMGPVT